MQCTSMLVRVGLLLSVTLVSMAVAQDSTGTAAPPLASIVQELEHAQAQTHAIAPYEVIRDYQLSAASSSTPDSDVVAEVQFSPPRNKDYAIQKTSGSSRGLKIVRKILDHEIEQARQAQSQTGFVNSENYDFTYLGESTVDGQPCYRLGLKPKRKATDLVVGVASVDKRSFLVRQIEGEVSKTPSWWLKSVHVKITFADMQGTWLQSGVEAVADVRFVGAQKLTSRTLEYRGADVLASNLTAVDRRDRAAQPKLQGHTAR